MADIIITGPNDEAHLENIARVMQRLSSLNIKLKEKCSFSPQDSMEYFAFQIDKEGIHPTEEKLAAIKDAPFQQQKKRLVEVLVRIGQLLQKVHQRHGYGSHSAK